MTIDNLREQILDDVEPGNDLGTITIKYVRADDPDKHPVASARGRLTAVAFTVSASPIMAAIPDAIERVTALQDSGLFADIRGGSEQDFPDLSPDDMALDIHVAL